MDYLHEKKDTGPFRPAKFPPPRPDLAKYSAEYLASRELSAELAAENGWYTSEWRGVPVIVIPAWTSYGAAWFQVRATVPTDWRYDSPKGSRGDALGLVWPTCYGGAGESGIVVVEGPMDALAVAEVGLLGIAMLGKNPSASQLERLGFYLSRIFAKRVLVVPDRDGLELVEKVLTVAPSNVVVRVLVPPVKDFAAMSRKERGAFLNG